MKKTVAILLIVSIAFTLFGCGKTDLKGTTSFSSDATTSEETKKNESTTQKESESQTESVPSPQPMDRTKNTKKIP